MPTLPWTSTSHNDPDADYLIIATRFTVVHRHHLPLVAAATNRLWTDFHHTDGLIGYSLASGLTRGTLSTLSAWRDHDAMLTFIKGPAHQQLVADTRNRLKDSTFSSWQTTGAQLPPARPGAQRRLAHAAALADRQNSPRL